MASKMNPAGFLVNEETGDSCAKCGAPMIAVEWDYKWFQGCSKYHETGCRSSKPLPKRKKLVDKNGRIDGASKIINVHDGQEAFFGFLRDMKTLIERYEGRIS